MGGGFAGLQALRALRHSPDEVLLFEPQERTVMLPALPDVAGGWVAPAALAYPLARLVPPGVRHVRAAVTRIDLDRHALTVDGETHVFDRLLLAAGSRTDLHGFDRSLDRVHRLDSLEGAVLLRDSFAAYLDRCPEPHIFMAGGGYTGLELAVCLLYRARARGLPCRATVADPAPGLLPFLPAERRERILRFLGDADIAVRTGVKVDDFNGRDVTAAGGKHPDVFFCWAAGSAFAIPEVTGTTPRLRDGRFVVNPDLSLPGRPDVFAAGDAAAFEHRGAVLRKAVNFAWHEGRQAGRNLALRARGRPTQPFRPVDLGWVIPLHAESAGQLFGRVWVRGRPGLRLHYLMCGFRNRGFTNRAVFAMIAARLFDARVSRAGKEKP